MNRFLLIFCLLLSSKLHATVIEQCIQNTSSCIYTEIDPQKYRRPTVFVPVEAYSILNVAEVNEQEVDFQPIYKESIQKDLQGRKNFTEVINVQANFSDLANLGPQERAVVNEMGSCGFAILTCGGTEALKFVPYVSMIAYVASKGVCTWTGYQCASTMMSYLEWRTALAERRATEKIKASYKGPGNIEVQFEGQPIFGTSGMILQCTRYPAAKVIVDGIESIKPA